MALYTLTNAQLAFGDHFLLDKANFSLEAGERVGLIGRNGTGKSSLLKIVADEIRPDDGLISRQQNLKTAYVAQENVFDSDSTVFETVGKGLYKERALFNQFDQISHRLMEIPADDKEHDSLLSELGNLQTELDATDAWQWQNKVEAALTQFSLSPDTKIAQLSGGMQKRVALAQVFVTKPDVLLLDEPTNHLDFEAIRWLEALLISSPMSVFFVTHDRAFLNNVATRIVELDRGQLRSYPGNFSAYQIQKEQQLEVERIENAKFDKLLAQEEIWIRKGIEARRTRSVSRIERLKTMRNEYAARRNQSNNVKFETHAAEKSGKLVAELINVSKKFDQKNIVDQFSSTIMRGDKIGLIGPNGAGKTTLIKLILNEIKPDFGSVKIGTNIEVAYFDQLRAQLDGEKSLAETISPGADWVEINGNRKHVMSYLGDFLFSPQRARSQVKSLSGGERNRLLLAQLFARPSNVLVLDEPTNDLDIQTLELLEELLIEYKGTLLLVSHDRTFLDNVVTSVIASESNGKWRECAGSFSDWERENARVEQFKENELMQNSKNTLSSKPKGRDLSLGKAVPARPANEDRKKSESDSTARKPNKAGAALPKLNYKEKKELEALPARIAALENEQKLLAEQIEKGTIFKDDKEEAAKITARYTQIEEELLIALERWEALEK